MQPGEIAQRREEVVLRSPAISQRELAAGRSLDSFCYCQRRARVRGSARRRGRPPGGPSNLVSRYSLHPRRGISDWRA